MSDLPLKKLRNFGGKLGIELEALGCTTAGEVAQHPQAALEARFGLQRAAWMLQAVNGISDEPVQVSRGPPHPLWGGGGGGGFILRVRTHTVTDSNMHTANTLYALQALHIY